MLCGAKDTLALPEVLVRGWNNEKISHRDHVLNKRIGAEPAFIKGKTVTPGSEITDTVRYADDLYPWLLTDSLSLIVRVREEGCCNGEWLPALASAAKAPKQEPVEPEVEETPVDTTPQITEPVEVFVPAFAVVSTFEPDSFAAELVKNNPVALQYKNYKPYDNTFILAKDSGALYVHFPLDKVILLREFSNNAVILDSIMYMINSLMADTTTEVKVIQIIGLASIEGNVPHNEWLAGNRAMALQKYIQERIDTTGIVFEAANGGEAWTEFKWLAEQQQFEGRDRVIEIINKDPDLNSRERWLRTLNNGRTWAYIKKHLLPPLRNSGYVRVYYDVKPDANGIIINEAVELLRNERYADALSLLLKVRNDNRAQNALGTAYYMTGDRDNAIRCFRLAAAEGDEDAIANLKAILIDGK